MTFNILHLCGGLLFFVGTYCMIASFEEHTKKNNSTSNFFMFIATVVYIGGAVLISMSAL